MKFVCDKCQAQYLIADEKIGPRGVKVKCKKCGNVMVVRLDGVVGDAKPAESKPAEPKPTEPKAGAGGGVVRTSSKAAPLQETSTAGQKHPGKGKEDHPAPQGAVLTKKTPPSEREDATVVMSGYPSADQEAAKGRRPTAEVSAPPPPPPEEAYPSDQDATRVAMIPEITGPSLHLPTKQPAKAAPAVEAPKAAAKAPPTPPPPADDPFAAFDQKPEKPAKAAKAPPPPPPPADDPFAAFDQKPEKPAKAAKSAPPAPPADDPFAAFDQKPEKPAKAAKGAPSAPPPPADDPFAAFDDKPPQADAAQDPFAAFDQKPEKPAKAAAKVEPEPAKAGPPKKLDAELEGAFDGLFGADGTEEEPKPAKAKKKDKDKDKATIDWYAAIRDEQKGPFSLEQVEGYWKKGDIDAGSLVWRGGMADWIPLRDVKELKFLLDVAQEKKAPAPPPPGSSSTAGLMPSAADDMSEETWRPRGMTAVYQASAVAEMRAQLAAESGEKGVEDESAWKPGAASALSSLVSDELASLDEKKTGGRSKLDALSGELPQRLRTDDSFESGLPVGSGAPPTPLLAGAGGLGLAFMPQPQKPTISPVVLGLVGGGVVVVGVLVLLVLIVVGVIPVGRQPAPVQVAVAGTPAGTPVGQPGAPPADQPGVQPGAAAPASGEQPAAGSGEPPKGDDKGAAGGDDKGKGQGGAARPRPQADRKPERRDDPKPEEKKPEPKEKPIEEMPVERAKPRNDCDPILYPEGCEKTGSKTAAAKPAGKETLSKADVLGTVKANRGDVSRCVSEQKKKDPSLAEGTIKMTWTIKNDGSTSDVSVGSADFADAYIGKCMVRAIQGWKFEAYTAKEIPPINFPFPLDKF
jgi:predicted Zn finger-like uncharacterized protein